MHLNRTKNGKEHIFPPQFSMEQQEDLQQNTLIHLPEQLCITAISATMVGYLFDTTDQRENNDFLYDSLSIKTTNSG